MENNKQPLLADNRPAAPDNHAQSAGRRLWPRAHPVSWWMLAITTLAIFINSIDRVILPTLLPAIMQDFALSEIEAGWLTSLSFLGTLVGAVIFGILSDYIGTGYRRCYSWAAAVLLEVAAGIATAFCKSLAAFQLLRVIMGVGSGGAEPINVALLSEWWQKERRGFAIGVHHTGFPLGQFFGPALIALVLGFATWRQVFLLIPLLGLIIVAMHFCIGTRGNQRRVYRWIRRNRLTLPVDEALQSRPPSLRGTLKQSLGCLKNRNCLMAIALVFGFVWAEMGIAHFLTLQLTREVGLDLASAAMISGASGITGWAGQILWGGYSDIKGRKVTLCIIIIGWMVAAALCIFIRTPTTAWAILIFWGLFRNSPFPVAYALLIDSAPKAAASSMGLMIGLAVGCAGMLVAPTAGWIIHCFGFSAHYLVIVGVLLLSCIPLWLIREPASPKLGTREEKRLC